MVVAVVVVFVRVAAVVAARVAAGVAATTVIAGGSLRAVVRGNCGYRRRRLATSRRPAQSHEQRQDPQRSYRRRASPPATALVTR